ncbi:DUF6374 family protein [Nocardia salmonicida]|uniref:DUF6374 family protein n=1 Tax=Nocardia salmonicida TaxID=53431 RepID=UPI0037B6EF96
MPQTTRPDWAAAALATVRVKLLEACAFGAVASADHVIDNNARFDERRQRQFSDYPGRYRPRRPLHPRSPMGCQGYRQVPT